VYFNINQTNSFKKITFAVQISNMKKSLFLWLVLSCTHLFFSQENRNLVNKNRTTTLLSKKTPPSLDSITNAKIVVQQKIETSPQKKNKVVPLDSIRNMYGGRYVNYKIITYAYDTIQIDTTLQISNFFKHNYTEKDDFEWVALANQGQTYNKLGYNFVNNQITPEFGFKSKLYNYYSAEDMLYYHVPTPTTILFYRSGYDGQVLNTTFTSNFGKHQNFFIGYKGLRSIGEYQQAIASHVNFRVGYSYYNPEKRYQFRTHITSQKVDNQENGGLTKNSITQFKQDNPDFSARGRVNVNLYNAKSYFKSSRYYFEHELRLLNSRDSLQQKLTNLKIGHSINLENRNYQFTASDVVFFEENTSIYGNKTNSNTSERTEFNTLRNQFYLKFNSPWILGNFKVFSSFYNTTHTFNAITPNNNAGIKISEKEKNINHTSFGANWNGEYKGVFLNIFGQQVVTGKNLSNNIHVNAGFKLKNDILVKGGLQLKNVAPNATANLFQSNWSNLNWNQSLDNENYRILYGKIQSKWINIDTSLNQIKNYIYYNTNSVVSQYNQTIDYAKLKVSNQFKYKNFRLNNSILYQQTLQGNSVFRVPDLVTRNTLYYQDYFFKGDPLEAQIGITFKYFNKYFANEFNPILNEFYIQNNTKIGGYPMLNVFVNGKVRRTRIYFIVENITASLTGRNYFATPSQPQTDLKMRLGLVWNFWN